MIVPIRAEPDRGPTAVSLMFLAWWGPASLSGWLPWWGQPLVWLGLAVTLGALRSPPRATVKQTAGAPHASPFPPTQLFKAN